MQPIIFIILAFVGAFSTGMAMLIGAGIVIDALRNRHAGRRMPPFE